MKSFVILLALILPTSILFSQTDNLFWFAAPDVSSIHGAAPQNGAPIYLHIVAENLTTVTISQPANTSFTPIIIELGEQEARSIRLDTFLSIDQIENYPQFWPVSPGDIQKKAFKITADPGNIAVSYELDNEYNKELFTLKGRNAMGRDFFVSTQNFFPNGSYSATAWSGFVIAATKNNTRIVVFPNDDWYMLDTNPGDSVVLTLNAGETFAFRAASTDANRHINGVPVKSDKDIVITFYDDSIRKKRTANTTCTNELSFDIIGDQLIPVEHTGKEYIVIKGDITTVSEPNCPADGGERIFITSTEPNTLITIDGVLLATITEAGQVFSYQIDSPMVHVMASKPVYINHITGFGGELGGALLPSIDDCCGSYNVSFVRSPNPADHFIMNLMARNVTSQGSPFKNRAAGNFILISNGVATTIPENYFDYIMDSTWIVLKKNSAISSYISAKLLPGQVAKISNSVASFHLGVISGGSTTGCKYGYFSNYSATMPTAGIGGSMGLRQKALCSIDSALLVASGGLSYKWFSLNNPVDTLLLNNTTSNAVIFKPLIHGYYKFGVRIYGGCYSDTINLGLIYIEPSNAALEIPLETCSGETVQINNNGFAQDNQMIIDDSAYYDVDFPYNIQFENNTDSVVTKKVFLTTFGTYHLCPNHDTAYIKIFPAPHANFSITDIDIFNGDPVHFTNQSTGNNLSFLWNFGDGTQSTDTNTSHIFSHMEDTVFTVGLVATNAFLCSDSIIRPIALHVPINHDSIAVIIAADIFNEDWELDEWLYLRITDTVTHLVWYDSLATVTKENGFNDTAYLDAGIYKCEILDMGANVEMPVIKIDNHIVPYGYPEFNYYLFTVPGIYNTENTIWHTACDSLVSPTGKYTWFTGGTYYDTIPNAEGFDSLLTINLIIQYSSSAILNETACFSYTSPAGILLENSGVYHQVITNTAGCDSSITINLTIINVDNTVETIANTMAASEEGATYQWLSCASGLDIEGATDRMYNPIVTGLYAVRITKDGCTVTSSCNPITAVDAKILDIGLTYYPNPVTDELFIDLKGYYSNIEVSIDDMAGKPVLLKNFAHQNLLAVDTKSLTNGVYLVRITADGQNASFKIVK
jgi:PKD repeat protein